MNKLVVLTLALAVLVFGSFSPAQADTGKEMANNAILLPVKAAAVASGWVLGIPVAMVRRTSNRSIEFTQTFADKIGGKDHLVPMTFASVMGVPFGLIVGTGEGVYWGGRNALQHGVEKPFSLASFSLDEKLEE